MVLSDSRLPRRELCIVAKRAIAGKFLAKVHFEERSGGWSIQEIDLDTEASISDMAAEGFEEHAPGAKKNCPVSRALSGLDIYLRAKLLQVSVR